MGPVPLQVLPVVFRHLLVSHLHPIKKRHELLLEILAHNQPAQLAGHRWVLIIALLQRLGEKRLLINQVTKKPFTLTLAGIDPGIFLRAPGERLLELIDRNRLVANPGQNLAGLFHGSFPLLGDGVIAGAGLQKRQEQNGSRDNPKVAS